jgi:hypothetical protein
MSEVNLLAFGCCVSFIALAGFYVYIRECFTAGEEETIPDRQPIQTASKTELVDSRASDAAR